MFYSHDFMTFTTIQSHYDTELFPDKQCRKWAYD